MELKISTNQSSRIIDIEPREDLIYKEIGQTLLNLGQAIPNTITASCPYGDVSFLVRKRGTFIKDGVTYPSAYAVEDGRTLHGLSDFAQYPETYLTCINPESNNYKCATSSVYKLKHTKKTASDIQMN